MSTLSSEPAQAAPREPDEPIVPAPETPAPAQAAEEPAAPAPASPNGEPPSADGKTPKAGTNLNEVIRSGDLAAMRSLLRSGIQPSEPAPVSPAPESKPSGEEPPKPQGEESAASPPPPEPENDDEQPLPKRIRIENFGDPDKEFLLAQTRLARSEKISMSEAARRLIGDPAKAAAPAPAPAVPGGEKPSPPEPDTPSPLDAQIAKVEDLKTQLHEAVKSYDSERQNDLQIELASAIAEQKLLEREQAQAASSQQASRKSEFLATERQSSETMIAAYPDFAKPGTPLHTAVTTEIGRLQKASPDFFKNPEWAKYLVPSVAATLGVLPTTAKPAPSPSAPAPAAAPVPKPAPKKEGHPAAIPPASGHAGAGQPPVNDEFAKVYAADDVKTLTAFLHTHGTRST